MIYSLSLRKHSEWVCPFIFHPYLMLMASMNSCLFSSYQFALIGKAESQENAPFSMAPFISCYDSGDSSSNIFFQQLQRFAFFSRGLKGCIQG